MSSKRAELVEVARRRRAVERDYIAGLVNGQELAARHGVSPSTITQDLKKIFDNWRELAEEEEELKKPIDRTHAILALTEVYRLAGEGFKRSRKNKQEVRTEYRRQKCNDCKGTGWKNGVESTEEWCAACDGDGEVTVELVTTKETGQAGDPTFLKVGIDAIKEIARLRALYPEKPRLGKQAITLNLFETGIDVNSVDADDIFTAKMILARLGQKEGTRQVIDERRGAIEQG